MLSLVIRSLIGVAFQIALMGAGLFLPAGTWDWPRAAQFLVVYGVVVCLAVVALARGAPGGLEARLAAPAAASQPPADRVATFLLVLSMVAWWVFIPIDVFRLQLLPPPPLLASILGAGASLTGLGVVLATMYQNAFVAPIVKDQSDRGQVLIDTGLYARIRHPMYNGMLIYFFGLALWLESTAAAVAVLALLPSFYARMQVEERTLRATLPGYTEYMERVPHRIVPHVW
jgi:protein-S-isoprenylcysteine O-methyltransferase Ste14